MTIPLDCQSHILLDGLKSTITFTQVTTNQSKTCRERWHNMKHRSTYISFCFCVMQSLNMIQTDPQSCPSNWTSACAQLTGHVSSQHRGEIQLQALEIEKDRDSDENNYPAGPNTCLDCAWGIFPKQCVHTQYAKGPGLDQGTLSAARNVWCKFLRKSALARCPCAFRLPRLSQSAGPGWPRAQFFVAGAVLCRLRQKSGWNPQPSGHFVCVCVGSLGLWRGDNLISLSRNPLGTLCGSDRSRCSALRILTWLVQPSPYIVCVGSLSLWCAVNFDMAPSTFSWLCVWQIALVVTRCWF